MASKAEDLVAAQQRQNSNQWVQGVEKWGFWY